MVTTLLVPGLDGSPAPHWQHWWAEADDTAILLELTDVANPIPEVWEFEIAAALLDHPGAVLVGHSLGAVVIANLLAKWPHLEVDAALLVAPADPNAHPRAARFAPLPEARLGVPASVVASRNDPWMSFSRVRQLSRAWGAELVDLGFAGHINVASGFGPWEQGMALRDRLMERRAAQRVASRLMPFPMEQARA